MEKRVQPGLDRPVQPADPVPGLLQGGAGPLGDLPVGLEAPVDAHREPLEVGQPLTHEGEAGNEPDRSASVSRARLKANSVWAQPVSSFGSRSPPFSARSTEPRMSATPPSGRLSLVLKERPCLVHPGKCFPDGRGVVEE